MLVRTTTWDVEVSKALASMAWALSTFQEASELARPLTLLEPGGTRFQRVEKN